MGRCLYIVIFLFLFNCDIDILDEDPPHFISSSGLYSTIEGLESGLNGIYALIREERIGPRGSDNLYNGLLAFAGTDNIVANFPRTDGTHYIVREWGASNNSLNVGLLDLWTWIYRIINACNSVIDHAKLIRDNSNSPNIDRIIAEATALRALQYRHLTFLWGDVPLNLEVTSGENITTDWERADVNVVRRHILHDLIFAENYIPIEPMLRGRITRGAIQHYISEMFLTINRPDSALIYADKVISTPEYKLITERYGVRSDKPGVAFMDMFYEGNENRDQGNTEALWVFQFGLDITGGGGSNIRRQHTGRFSDWIIDGVRALKDTYDRGGRGRSWHSLTQYAINLYEMNDDRFSNYAIRKYFILKDEIENAPYPADILPPGNIYGDTIWLNWDEDISTNNASLFDWPFVRKVEGTDPNNPGAGLQWNDQIHLRLAETYLLKAEAEYKLGFVEEAAKTINIIRRRSNASVVSGSEINIDFILDERSRELVMEEDRRYTLLRTNKWFERVSKYNKNGGQNIVLRDTLFPIPQAVIDLNLTKKMDQNPGF